LEKFKAQLEKQRATTIKLQVGPIVVTTAICMHSHFDKLPNNKENFYMLCMSNLYM